MDFLQLAQERFSVTSFSDKEIEQEKVESILRAGQVAPTACNLQPQKILLIQSKEALEKYRKCTVSHFNAPLAMLVCYDRTLCWSREYDRKLSGDVDAAIVTTHMMLEAADLGVGSAMVMNFIPEAVREEFKLPANYVPVCLLALGYPSKDAKPNPGHTSNKSLSVTVSYNEF
ncbi:MAG TPA: nitroreductase family protein [Lachnospiraceae bacterium]|nr:nitroreductase family protein [Lachnospiraceae bacterium]HPF29727.1 nitroreductase family protein [Lachnospiraceae bacterium]